jgi:hypothetical protein
VLQSHLCHCAYFYTLFIIYGDKSKNHVPSHVISYILLYSILLSSPVVSLSYLYLKHFSMRKRKTKVHIYTNFCIVSSWCFSTGNKFRCSKLNWNDHFLNLICSSIAWFDVLIALIIKRPSLWDITPCNPLKIADVSEENVASSLRCACYLLHSGFLYGLFFDPEGGGSMLLRNVSWLPTDHTALYPRRQDFVLHLFLYKIVDNFLWFPSTSFLTRYSSVDCVTPRSPRDRPLQ